MSTESAVRIAVLLPDVLGTYSDAGNATVLAQRLRWRGVPAEVVAVPAGSTPPTACDVFVLGGGEDAAQLYAADWLRQHDALRLAMQLTQVVAVCAGLQVLGRWMQGTDGRRHPGADLLDVTTTPGPTRAVGEITGSCTDPTIGVLTGFENHRGYTSRGPGLAALSLAQRGTGNGDGTDGVLTDRVVGTYLHGPVLTRNPQLADLVLRRVTGRSELPPLTVAHEDAVRAHHLARTHHLPLAGHRVRAGRPRHRA
jgi:CobQ-like glutamine amidotransferase family enzyme